MTKNKKDTNVFEEHFEIETFSQNDKIEILKRIAKLVKKKYLQ